MVERHVPTGDLTIQMADMAGSPVRNVIIDFDRFDGEPGTGGEALRVTHKSPVEELSITGISCRPGPGTLYRVTARAEHYRPYTFIQLIQEERMNTASDDVEFWVGPQHVTGIRAPHFAALPPRARRVLDRAEPIVLTPDDRDLAGLSGETLYRRLGPLRQACFLNLTAKAAHKPTTDGCLPAIDALLVCRQDRFFATVRADFAEQLRQSPLFVSAPSRLHQPLPGYVLAEGSFKTRDAHANLQVTFMRHVASGRLAADIDIDESLGIRHGFEVIRNAVFERRTNPYLIREFLLAADPLERSLDPGYAFAF